MKPHSSLLVGIAGMIFATLAGGCGTDTTSSREPFNTGWLFARFGPMPDGSAREEPAGLQWQDADDASWRKVDLPHDWAIEGPFRMDLPSSTGKLPWVGIGWYRKHFDVPGGSRGRRFFIDFDGAMSHAQVWLNGHEVGQWPYGYASFRLELTPHIRFDAENVLAVRLDNPPNSSRWYPGGGIYRNVWLVTTAPVHGAHWGSFVSASKVTKERATVRMRTEVENQSAESAEVEVEVDITEYGKSAVVASVPAVALEIPAGGSRASTAEVEISSPRLWELESPSLYRARTIIRQGSRMVDEVNTVFGIRSAEFTADNGFVLNGRRVLIRGVCNHHDLGPLGTAVSVAALERQIRLLKEMGCNALRTSHNPPAPELLDLCDRMGMLVLDEAFDCWQQGKTPNDYSTLFKEWHEKDIRALVRRDRNHPSVVAWSSGNEVREQAEGSLAQALRALFHAEDPTRPVTVGCDNPEAGFNGFQNSVDVFGYNYKPHLYGKFREANPTKPLFGSETASCVSTIGEYFFPVSNMMSEGFATNQVSSYDLYAPPWATTPDVEFEGQERNPTVAGEFVWTGFDYLGEPTPFGEDRSVSRSSYFGIMDLCGFKKDRFYLYQARWRPDLPMVHILPHWNWPGREGEITPVHVYTSGDEAELFLNNQSLGRKKKEPYQYRLVWGNVKYTPGELKAVAYRKGAQWASASVRTAGQPAGLALSADRQEIRAGGGDLAFVSVAIVDRNGLMVPAAANLVKFTVSGPGAFVAAGNGDPTDHTSFQSNRYKAFHGRCLAIVRATGTGEITLTAESDSLKGARVVVTATGE